MPGILENINTTILQYAEAVGQEAQSQYMDTVQKIYLLLSKVTDSSSFAEKVQALSGIENLITGVGAKSGKSLGAVSATAASSIDAEIKNFYSDPANGFNLRDGGASMVNDDFRKAALYNVLTSYSKLSTDYMLEIYTAVKQSVMGGAPMEVVIDTLRKIEIQNNAGTGVAQYANAIAIDALHQYTAQINKAIMSGIGAEWFSYTGSLMETSRCFCVALEERGYFHKMEVPQMLRGKYGNGAQMKCMDEEGNEHAVKLYKKTDLPSGMYPGTNDDTFYILRGGYNCGHQTLPVHEEIIPVEIVMEVKGWLKGQRLYNMTDVIDYQARVRTAEASLRRTIQDVWGEFSGVYDSGVNYKSEQSILRKLVKEYGGDLQRLKDGIRATIVVDSESSLKDIVTKLKAMVKAQPGASYTHQNELIDALGYSGHNFKLVADNGIVYELQVNTEDMIYAKESRADAMRVLGEANFRKMEAKYPNIQQGLGHVLYDKFRQYPDTSIEEAIQLAIQSREYYAHFRKQGAAQDVKIPFELNTYVEGKYKATYDKTLERLIEKGMTEKEAQALISQKVADAIESGVQDILDKAKVKANVLSASQSEGGYTNTDSGKYDISSNVIVTLDKETTEAQVQKIMEALNNAADQQSSNAFMKPTEAEIARDGANIHGMVKFVRPSTMSDDVFGKMMFELAGIKDDKGRSFLTGHSDFTDTIAIGGHFYDMDNMANGEGKKFVSQVAKNIDTIVNVLFKYGVDTDTFTLTKQKVLIYDRQAITGAGQQAGGSNAAVDKAAGKLLRQTQDMYMDVLSKIAAEVERQVTGTLNMDRGYSLETKLKNIVGEYYDYNAIMTEGQYKAIGKVVADLTKKVGVKIRKLSILQQEWYARDFTPTALANFDNEDFEINVNNLMLQPFIEELKKKNPFDSGGSEAKPEFSIGDRIPLEEYTVKALIAHEYGHLVDFSGRPWNEWDNSTSLKDKSFAQLRMIDIKNELGKLNGRGRGTPYISRYACANKDESFAESFLLWYMRDELKAAGKLYPRDAAVIKLMEEYMEMYGVEKKAIMKKYNEYLKGRKGYI